MKTILITGATDGIGLETAKMLAAEGHILLLHGRSAAKLEAAAAAMPEGARIETYRADFSVMEQVEALTREVSAKHDRLDILINNAGVFKTPDAITADGLDVRFAVNTLAVALLTERLLLILSPSGRVVSLSSAAQAPVDTDALAGREMLDEMAAYSQSKLAMTIWSQGMAEKHPDGPVFIAVNPGSLLASKMVTEGFGIPGSDLSIGAGILTRAALSDEFADASGKYYDNDSHQFSPPHSDALNAQKSGRVIRAIEDTLKSVLEGQKA